MGTMTEAGATGVQDRIFAESRPATDFHFGTDTAAVFDDMVARSVPFYDEFQRMSTELASEFFLYDQ